MFQSDDISNTDEANDSDLFSTKPTTTTKTNTTTTTATSSKLGGLFSEEDEDDGDIFSQLTTLKNKEATPPIKHKVPSTTGKGSLGLFGEGDEDELFIDETPPAKEEVVKHESPKPVKKKPAGAVSMFGGAVIDPFANKKKGSSSSDRLTESTEREGGDLFTSMKEAKEPPIVAKKKVSSVCGH